MPPSSTLPVPDRTAQQRAEALLKANHVRQQRAQLKIKVKERKADVPTLLREPRPEIMTMKVMELMLAMPKFGKHKVLRLLRDARVSTAKTVGGLSDRQRMELADSIVAAPCYVPPSLLDVFADATARPREPMPTIDQILAS